MKEQEIKTLILYRISEAKTTLEDAKCLIDCNRSSQSIVNRIYYAMFYSVLALLQSIGKIPSKHKGVISLFDTEFVLKNIFPKEMSKNFHRAFEMRQSSDYRVVKSISTSDIEILFNNAEIFINEIEKFLQPPIIDNQ